MGGLKLCTGVQLEGCSSEKKGLKCQRTTFPAQAEAYSTPRLCFSRGFTDEDKPKADEGALFSSLSSMQAVTKRILAITF